MNEHEKINYVELPSSDMHATKKFFESAFGWTFQDFGPDYMAFSNAGLEGGFFKSELCSTQERGGTLVVLYSSDLESTREKVETEGGSIVSEILKFPGGRRFHFKEPAGNEMAVWSDIDA